MYEKMHKRIPQSKIAIIGAGAVGSTIAYTLVIKTLAAEVVLIDVNENKKVGEVMDLDDGQCFSETGTVSGGDFKDAGDADVIVLTAGAAQKPGETRLDLVNKNKQICESIFKSIGKIKPTAIIVVVANPVDVITYLAQQFSGLPRSQVFGTGTALDTARLRTEVAKEFGVSPQSVSGFMLGEHGDTEFAAWSTVSIGGIPLKEFKISAKKLQTIEKRVKTAAYEIINRKGATYYGIAMSVTDILEAILFDQHKILPLSPYLDGCQGVKGMCLGVPAVLGRQGVEKIWPLKLPADEKKKFQDSAKTIKKFL